MLAAIALAGLLAGSGRLIGDACAAVAGLTLLAALVLTMPGQGHYHNPSFWTRATRWASDTVYVSTLHVLAFGTPCIVVLAVLIAIQL